MNRAQLLKPAVYGYLCFGEGLPGLCVTLAEAIMREWNIDLETLDRLGVCGYPSRLQNLFISEECAKRYGDLSTVDGFYQCRGFWWMDLDEQYVDRGFLMPVTSGRFGWISRLIVFRHPKDKHPFTLKVRREMGAAA